jgi:hypothetical protein
MSDQDLRARFAALRAADRKAFAPPGFAATLAAARQRRGTTRPTAWAWGALATSLPAIALLGLAIGMLAERSERSTGAEAAAAAAATDLGSWLLPTDELLATSDTTTDALTELDLFDSPTADLLNFELETIRRLP